MAPPLVFSFVNEQRRFLFLLIGFLTFLMVVSSGVLLSIATAVGRFSSNLERSGIIQVMRGGSVDAAVKIIDESKPDLASVRTVGKDESSKILNNWLKSPAAVANYIPHTIQIRAKTVAGLDRIAKRAEGAGLKFAHGRGASPDRIVGIKIMLISGFIFMAILLALTLCVVHSVRNIITIHRREIGILGQVGATPNYVARQIQAAMLMLGAKACAAGLIAGWMMMVLINGLSRSSHVGLLANMGMDGFDWAATFAISVALVVLIVFITRRTTLKVIA